MMKFERVYLRKQSGPILAGLETLYGYVKDQLVSEGFQASAYQQIGDITVALMGAGHGVLADVSLLDELGETGAAAARVAEGLAILRSLDGHLFDPPPSERLMALLAVGENADKDSYVSAISQAAYADLDTRRRNALIFKRRLVAAGLPVPTEADIEHAPTWSEARADQWREGSGAKASGNKTPSATKTSRHDG